MIIYTWNFLLWFKLFSEWSAWFPFVLLIVCWYSLSCLMILLASSSLWYYWSFWYLFSFDITDPSAITFSFILLILLMFPIHWYWWFAWYFPLILLVPDIPYLYIWWSFWYLLSFDIDNPPDIFYWILMVLLISLYISLIKDDVIGMEFLYSSANLARNVFITGCSNGFAQVISLLNPSSYACLTCFCLI